MKLFMVILVAIFSGLSHNPNFFKEYLKKQDLPIAKSHTYLILSQYSCISCSKQAFNALNSLNDCPKLIVLTGDRRVKDQLKNKPFIIHYDPVYEFDYLPYNWANTSLINLAEGGLKIKSYDATMQFKLAQDLKELCSTEH